MNASTWSIYIFFALACAGILVPILGLVIARELRRQQVRLPAATRLEDVEHQLVFKQEELARLVASKHEELADLDQRIREMHGALAQRDQAEAEARIWLEKLDQARTELDGMAIRLQELEACKRELAKYHEDVASAQETLTAINAERNELGRQTQALKLQIERIEERRTHLNQDCETLEEKRRGLESVVEAFRRQERDLEGGVARLQQERDSTRKELDNITVELKDLRHERAELEAKLAEIKASIAGLSATESGLVSDVDELRKLSRDRKGEVATLERHRDELSRETQSMEASHKHLQEKLAEMTSALLSARKEEKNLDARLLGLKAEIAALEGSKAALNAYINRAHSTQSEQGTESLKDLLEPPACFKDNRSFGGPENELEALDRLRSRLDQLKLRFSHRTLNAFHTCLKIADISPLTVLAGISGTGKSLLPRQYAEAMGIHFIQLAVQPRWDSPQDLFGFYNYLEQRYKATELARAMVHLDYHNWKQQAEPYKNRMVLVLLDEMNLARVEYYFSEFLSRLEARGGDPKAREIELDLGHVRGDNGNRVYPVENLLFVGTMNEDESTQSLSDKVVDRANVLRFARPAQLAEKMAIDPGDQGAHNLLSLDTWRQWRREAPPPQHIDSLRDWIKRLNGALEGLGRPFGHRLNQAILAYVANHPEANTDTGVREAFADQLEFRIFPKLRGVEPDVGSNRDYLDEISKLLKDQLHDEILAGTFEEAATRELFVWSGVHREDRP